MVTYAVGKSGNFILHVSRLAAHTQDKLDHPQVSWLITESETSGKMPQALARVTVEGQAEIIGRESEKYNGGGKYTWHDSRTQRSYLNLRISTFSSSNQFPPVSSQDLGKLAP